MYHYPDHPTWQAIMNYIRLFDPTANWLQVVLVMPEAKRPVPLFVNKEIWPSDLRRFREGLYRNTSGYWFLAGQGGSRSRFAVGDSTDGRKGSTGIIPIGHSQAMRWLAENGNVAVLRDLFSEEKAYLQSEFSLNL